MPGIFLEAFYSISLSSEYVKGWAGKMSAQDNHIDKTSIR
jgi:hypothetical protein